MERSEQALVPEWLRCSVSATGGSNSAQQIASSCLHSDLSSSSRSRSFRSITDKDSPRTSFLDRSSSSHSIRSSSSNVSTKHPYSIFARNHCDRNRDKEKENSVGGDPWDHDTSDPLGSILISRTEKNTLRCSQSMVSRNNGELLPRRIEDARNGVSSGASNLIATQKIVSDKDFPSLGTEGKQGASDIGRVSSPGLSSAVQSLPIGSSALVASEKWSSALAEVPAIIGINGMTNSSVQQCSSPSPASAGSSAVAGLNMAEALSQAQPRTRTAPKEPDKIQRLEELAIKQSRQLIPMVPYTHDKSKQLKTTIRTNEVILTPKSVQQQANSCQHTNHSRGGQVKSDASSTPHFGKFLVLKPSRENGVASPKDLSSQTNNPSGQVSNGHVPAAPPTPTTMSLNKPKVSSLENKSSALSLNSRVNLEKRPSPSQAQSRSDFFKLMRKKSSNNAAVSSPKLERSSEIMKEMDNLPVCPHVCETDRQVTSNGNAHKTPDITKSFTDGDKNLYVNGTVCPDEEEAAFLRSLGWEENTGDDEGLTEEEINAFYQEYMKSRPSLKVWRGTQPKLLSEFHTIRSGIASSESSSSGSA